MKSVVDGVAMDVVDSVNPNPQARNGGGEALMDLPTVARTLAVSTRTVHRLIAAGLLPHPAKVGRASRWFASDIARFLARLRTDRDRHHEMTPAGGAA